MQSVWAVGSFRFVDFYLFCFVFKAMDLAWNSYWLADWKTREKEHKHWILCLLCNSLLSTWHLFTSHHGNCAPCVCACVCVRWISWLYRQSSWLEARSDWFCPISEWRVAEGAMSPGQVFGPVWQSVQREEVGCFTLSQMLTMKLIIKAVRQQHLSFLSPPNLHSRVSQMQHF